MNPWIIVLFSLSLGGALLEGLWPAMPPFLVQVNGLLLLLTALWLLFRGARHLLARNRAGDGPAPFTTL